MTPLVCKNIPTDPAPLSAPKAERIPSPSLAGSQAPPSKRTHDMKAMFILDLHQISAHPINSPYRKKKKKQPRRLSSTWFPWC